MTVKYIKLAAKIASRVMDSIFPEIKEGVTEKYISSLIRKKIKELGGERESFKIIIASGKRSALPHGYASHKKIKNGDLVMIDFGVLLKKYRSDITRTFAVGNISKKQKKTYDLVKRAQLKAINEVKAGVPVKKIDEIVRQEFKKFGVEKYFPHSTGHGIGIKVHEKPRISAKSDEVLRKRMVITIEPGLYFKKLKNPFGIRIEDMVLVTKNGGILLTDAKK